MLTTQAEVRASFWEAHPTLQSHYRANKRQNQYPTDVRCAFIDHVEMLQRNQTISERLAEKVTL